VSEADRGAWSLRAEVAARGPGEHGASGITIRYEVGGRVAEATFPYAITINAS
jgi:hypothetical protein